MAIDFNGKTWKNFMAKLYGFGASIVIIGALFKIQHWPGAGIMLTIGLGTEAIIFAFSAFEPIHEEYDWTLVYPELAGMHGDDETKELEQGSVTEQLDNLLEEAKIGPELISSLGSGLQKLSESANKLSNISDASVATNQFTERMNSASKNMESLADTYAKATESVSQSVAKNVEAISSAYSKANQSVTESVNELASSYTKANDKVSDSAAELSNSYSKAAQSLDALATSNSESHSEAQTYVDQLQKVSKNLAALNAAYELQLQGSSEHLKATNKLYEGIEELMENLHSSADDTKKYRSEMATLSGNLEALNTVYGNMLSAMNYKK